jgi:hypothetical protein
MSRALCSLMLALSVALLAFGPTAAFANSSNPKCPPFTCTQGNSPQDCNTTGDGCVKKNPGGKNCTGPEGLCK